MKVSISTEITNGSLASPKVSMAVSLQKSFSSGLSSEDLPSVMRMIQTSLESVMISPFGRGSLILLTLSIED